jgi:hypothetical protein
MGLFRHVARGPLVRQYAVHKRCTSYAFGIEQGAWLGQWLVALGWLERALLIRASHALSQLPFPYICSCSYFHYAITRIVLGRRPGLCIEGGSVE